MSAEGANEPNTPALATSNSGFMNWNIKGRFLWPRYREVFGQTLDFRLHKITNLPAPGRALPLAVGVLYGFDC